jgi:hypothetical protein
VEHKQEEHKQEATHQQDQHQQDKPQLHKHQVQMPELAVAYKQDKMRTQTRTLVQQQTLPYLTSPVNSQQPNHRHQ